MAVCPGCIHLLGDIQFVRLVSSDINQCLKCHKISRDLINRFDKHNLENFKVISKYNSHLYLNFRRNFQSALSADGLAPLGARPSANTVMTNYASHIYTGPGL